MANNGFLNPANANERELHRARVALGLSSLNSLYKIIDAAPQNARRWTKGSRGIGAPYGMRLLHVMRLRQDEKARGIPPEQSRFADITYDWQAHWYYLEHENIDGARRHYSIADRYK
jgi:hypothetical protein